MVGSAETVVEHLEFVLGRGHEPGIEHELAHEHVFGDASGCEREAEVVHVHGFATEYVPCCERIEPQLEQESESGGNAVLAEIAESGTAFESEEAKFGFVLAAPYTAVPPALL